MLKMPVIEVVMLIQTTESQASWNLIGGNTRNNLLQQKKTVVNFSP